MTTVQYNEAHWQLVPTALLTIGDISRFGLDINLIRETAEERNTQPRTYPVIVKEETLKDNNEQLQAYAAAEVNKVVAAAVGIILKPANDYMSPELLAECIQGLANTPAPNIVQSETTQSTEDVIFDILYQLRLAPRHQLHEAAQRIATTLGQPSEPYTLSESQLLQIARQQTNTQTVLKYQDTLLRICVAVQEAIQQKAVVAEFKAQNNEIREMASAVAKFVGWRETSIPELERVMEVARAQHGS